MEKSWFDQPDECEDAKVLCRIWVHNVSAEVRKTPKKDYLLTTGNLFGSTTIRLPTSDEVFRMLEKISKLEEGKKICVPKEIILENCENDDRSSD